VKQYSFCPVCGGRLGRQNQALPGRSMLTCTECRFEFWQNSKPAVGALIVRTNSERPSLLLTRRGIEPHKGTWDCPGGYLENGEHPEEGLARELREELGVTIARPRLLTVAIDEYPRNDVAEEARFVLSLFYCCDIPADALLVPADDVAEAAWYPLHGPLPPIGFPGTVHALSVLMEVLRRETASGTGSG
jgi:ADP-ribose pyrophosphatase YjhB (NUDIX family)